MINKELSKRILTSFFLVLLLILMYSYTYILIISLIIISLISWIEFYGLISKIFMKQNFNNKIFIFLLKILSLLYLSLFSFIIVKVKLDSSITQIFIIYSFLVSVTSDIGGLVFGKMFKGKKLTRISPNKTISGSIGSFILSMMLIPLFIDQFTNLEILQLTILTFIISLVSQSGDLFISYLKRKARVKDTGDLLPGHGGFLDRIDGVLFSVPTGLMLFKIIY